METSYILIQYLISFNFNICKCLTVLYMILLLLATRKFGSGKSGGSAQ